MHWLVWFGMIVGGAIAAVTWFLADIRHLQQWSLKRAELGAQDKTTELERHFQSGLNSRRPMLRLFRRLAIPGLLEADYALHISNQGENDRALILAKQASAQAARRAATHLAVLPAEAMVLLRLGRYEQAGQVVQIGKDLMASQSVELAKDPGYPGLRAGIIQQAAMIEMNLGNLEAALKLGIEASAATVSDPARVLLSGILALQGRFKEALDALAYEPSSFSKFLNPEDLEWLEKDKVFNETARQTNEELSSVFGPAIDLGRALVFVESGDVKSLGQALEQVQSKLKSHRIVEHIYLRTRALWYAMNADVQGMETDLIRVRQLAADKPASRSAQYETHLASGRAFLLLNHADKACSELESANKLALHPLEKHVSLYWLARANQAAGNVRAKNQFEMVVADGFGTWMKNDSRSRSASLVQSPQVS